MKYMKNFKHKKIICVLLMISMICTGMYSYAYAATVTRVSKNAPSSDTAMVASDQYSSDWRYWLQGASKYGAVGWYGCHLVAYAKLLVECGCPVPAGFDPDMLYNWARGTSYNGQRYIRQDCYESNCAGYGMLPVKYAESLGYQIKLVGKYDVSALTETKKAEEILKYINAGYYVVLAHSQHFTYIAREESLAAQKAIVSDSRTLWSVNPITLFDYNNYKKTWSSYPKYTHILCYSVNKTNTSLVQTSSSSAYGVMKVLKSSNDTSSKYTMNTRETMKLKFFNAEGYDAGRDAGTITWSSSNSRIASVDGNGVVTALRSGICKITCKVKVSETNTIYKGTATITIAYASPTPTPVGYKPFASLTATPTPIDTSMYSDVTDAIEYLVSVAEDISDDTYGYERTATIPYADLYIDSYNDAVKQVSFIRKNSNKLHVIAASKLINITAEDIDGIYALINSGKNKEKGENYIRNGQIRIKMDDLYYYIILNVDE